LNLPITTFINVADIDLEANTKRRIRAGGYISSVQHQVSKKGTMYGRFKLTDFNGEREFMLFGTDYIKFKDMLVQDNKIMIIGQFQSRWNKPDDLEFKIEHIELLDNVKRLYTKRLEIEVDLKNIDVTFIKTLLAYVNTSGGCEICY
jgi:DNA polymerase III, alpha subunit